MAPLAADACLMVTTLFIGLVVFVWLRLLAIFVLVLADHASRAHRPAQAPGIPLDGRWMTAPPTGPREIVREELASLGRGRLLRHEHNLGKAAALNTGIGAVTTRFLLTLDADTIVSREAIEIAVKLLQRDEASAQRYAVVAFDVSVKPSASLFAEVQATEYDASLNFERRGQAVVHAVSVAPGAASLWRSADLHAIGGFSSATVTEDVDATLRLAARGRRAAHLPGRGPSPGHRRRSRT